MKTTCHACGHEITEYFGGMGRRYCAPWCGRASERPFVIANPVRLVFDPDTVDDKVHQEGGVSIQEIFADPLTRTLWLAFKAHYLTSQYFLPAVMASARAIRRWKPQDARELRGMVRTGDEFVLGGISLEFCHALYPYVQAALARDVPANENQLAMFETALPMLEYVVDLSKQKAA